MKIGAFSRKFGVTPSSIRYYVKSGILVPRKVNTQLDFSDGDVRDMIMLLELKKLNFSIQEIIEVFKIIRFYNWSDDAVYTALGEMYQQKQHEAEMQINELKGKKKKLDARIAECEN